MDDDNMLDSYRAYVRSQCGFYQGDNQTDNRMATGVERKSSSPVLIQHSFR